MRADGGQNQRGAEYENARQHNIARGIPAADGLARCPMLQILRMHGKGRFCFRQNGLARIHPPRELLLRVYAVHR